MHPALMRLVVYWPSIQPSAGAPADLGGDQRRLPARQAAVRRVPRGARPAARARRAPEGGRLGGLRRDHRHARVGGAPALGLRAPPDRPDQPDAAHRRAARLPQARARHPRGGPQGGRDAALLGAVERAQPPVLLLTAARRAVRRGPAEHLGRAVRRGRPRAARPRCARRPATSATCSARSPSWSGGCRSRRRSTSSSTPCPAKLLCGARAWTQHTYIGGEDVLDDVDARLKAKGCGDMPIWMTETGAGAPRTATRAHRRPRRRAARLPQRRPDPRRRGTATPASRPRSSTRCARTTCSRPDSSRPTSRAPIRR